MDLSAWRDVILIIWGLVASAAIVFIAVILFLFYRKTSALIESTDLMVARAGDVIDYLESEVVRPVSRLGTMIRGISKGISIFSSIFSNKEEKDE